jgi:hypothetical protein
MAGVSEERDRGGPTIPASTERRPPAEGTSGCPRRASLALTTGGVEGHGYGARVAYGAGALAGAGGGGGGKGCSRSSSSVM